ncbi:MAG: hypothetical protein QOG71_1025 [Pyrinomonadaceae bacterium]|nr:hypothetical protein [Pyrinomonadaceae bacterium]
MRLLDLEGVAGVGVREDDETGQCHLTIYVDRDDHAVRDSLPDQIEGVRLEIVRGESFRRFPQ